MVIQLDELIKVETPLGPGYAIIFESGADDNFWTVALSDTQAIVTFRQNQIRMGRCYTYDRGISDADMRKRIKQRSRP